MRKKAKSKSNRSSARATGFWISVVLLFLCATFHFFLFYNSFFRSLSKMNEEPIATITFKYKTAQRKFTDRNVWDRLRQNSPVYNGDTIHTSALSEATIWFNDGNVMELSENTMAQVYITEDKSLMAELDGGSAVLDSSGSDSGITLKSGDVQVAIEGGSSLSAGLSNSNGEAQNASFQVLKGNASVTDSTGKGESKKMGEGESVSVQVAQNQNDASKSRISVPNITILAPAQNKKYLYHSQGKYDVEFSWNIANPMLFSGALKVTVASDKNFKKIVSEKKVLDPVSENCTIALEPQVYYWKITKTEKDVSETPSEKSSDSSNIISSGKIQIVQSLPPALVAPIQNYVYSYRIKNPAVRLIWEESAFATSYLVEIAKSNDFKNPVLTQRTNSTSSIIGTLSEGKYFWRVTPYYTINKTGYAAESKVGEFAIEKMNELKKPVLLTPANGSMVNTESNTSSLSFSWKNDPDAAEYSFVLSEKEDLSLPLVDKIVRENYCRIDTSSTKIKDGKWYWSVVSRDAEGNISPSSAVRTVYAMKGKPEQHTIEPQNGYKMTQSLLADTKFTWKKNLPENFTSEIEVASDDDFKNLLFSQKVTGSSTTIKNLPLGTYYWRLKSTGVFNSDSDASDVTEIATSPKCFVVVGNLGAAELRSPIARIVARDGSPTQFRWDYVTDADYYKFFVSSLDGSILIDDTVYENVVSFDLFNDERFSDRSYYTVKIQANALAIPGISSRRSGDLSSNEFIFRRLRPVEVDFPAQNAVLDGMQVVLNPETARWSAADVLSEARFVLYRLENGEKVEVLKVPNDEDFYSDISATSKIAPFNVKLDTADGLRDGTYQIIVYAKTRDGIDITNDAPKNIRTFKIAPARKLDASALLVSKPQNFNAEYLRDQNNPKEITLEWREVPNATEYNLSISKSGYPKNLIELNLTETKYTIDFLSLEESERAQFSNGNFIWKVRAIRRFDSNKDGKLDKILQEGEVAQSSFTTSIPIPSKTRATGAVNPYGK